MATAQVPDDTDQHQMAATQTDEEQEYISKADWRVVFNFTTRRHVPMILGGIVSTVIAALTMPVFAIIYGFIFGDFTSYGGGLIDSHTLMKDLAKYCVILVGTTVLNWIASSFFFFCFLTFGEMQARSARNKIFDALMKKDIVWFDTRETGVAALLPTVQAHIRDLQLAVSSPLGETLQGIIQALSALGVAFYISWKLTLVVLSSIPLLYLALSLVANGQSLRAREQSETLQSALKYITTAITSIETVKCFNGERYELNNFKRITGLAASLYKWVANFRSMQIGLVQFFTFTMFVQGFWYGKHLIDTEENRAADILTTFWAVLMVIAPVTQLMPQMVVLQKGKAAGASLSLLLKSMSGRDQQLESRGQTKPARCVGDIEFKNVTFSYPSRADKVAIRDASLSIPAGETTFIIGKSGSGKSTLGQLLVRFYQPSTGHILLDGTPLEDLDVQWLRRNVTLVEQHSVMFSDTIYGNVALGKPDEMVYMQDIHDAVKFAMLEKVVGGLPDGLGTELGIKGSSMSGGQKQRLALARARIRDSPVLVLDESTSALDYITRATVYEALREWRKGKTTIIITHDISQIKADDFLYLLDDTQVVREGYRKELEAEGEGFLTFFQSSEEAEEAFSDGDAADYAEDDVDDRTGVNRRTLAVQIPPIVRPISSILFGQPVLESTFDKNSDTTAADISANLTVAPRASHYEHRELRPQARHSYAEGPESLQVPRKDQPPDLDDFLSKELSIRPDSLASQNFSWYGSNKHPMSFSKDPGSPTESTLSLPISPISLYPQPLPIPDSLLERPKTIGRPHIRQRIRSGVRILRYKEEPDEIGTSNESLPLREILMSVWPAIGWSSHMMAIGAFCFAMIHSACTPVFAMAFARLQSTYQRSSEQHNEARNYSLVILGVAVIDGLSMYLMFLLSDAVAQAWSLSLKTEAMRRILMQPREFFDKEENSTSRLAETLDHFAEEARNLPGRFACIFLAIFSMVTISVLWSMAISWKLALVAVATGPILFGITKLSNTISNHWERVASEADDKIGEILYETFVNIRTVRCLGLENHFRKKYQAATKDAVKVGVKRAAYSGSVYGMAFSSVQFVATLLYWYGGVLMANKELTASTVIECFLILMLSVNHVCSMAQYITQVNISRDAGTRLLRLARLPIDSHELSGTTKFDSIGDISFKNVSFTYPTRKDVPVLNDITFSIPAGSCTAIVGSSGSGKSTIASLLLKLYQADIATTTTPSSHSTSGIHITNHPITTLSTPHLRSHIALVPQTPVLFPGTITQNITYGLSPSLPETSISSVRAAAKAAGISDFIESLPQAYNTLVGEGGTGLSGGQAQRLAIARALVRKPDVLVLDEATSALDGVAAGVIRETVLGLVGSGRGGKDGGGSGAGEGGEAGGEKKKKMTVIIITHAREMMAIAEHVVMLDQGRVVEQGSFQELKRRRGSAFGKLLRGETG